MTTNKQSHYATLLAKKCFLSPQDQEIEALLGLDLPIDWSAPLSPVLTLADAAFQNISDDLLFKKWWASYTKQSPRDPWEADPSSIKFAGLPLVGGAILLKRFHILQSWLSADPGTSEQWGVLAQHPAMQNLAISASWPNLQDQLARSGVSAQLVNDLSEYRAQNLWLSATKISDFNKQAPSSWSAEQAIHWWNNSSKLFKNPKERNANTAWRLTELVRHHEAWSQWTPSQWEQFWAIQPPGLLTYDVTSSFMISSHRNVSKMLDATPWSNSPAFKDVMFNEVSEIIERGMPRPSYTHSSSTAQNTLMKGWATDTLKRIEIMRAHSPTSLENWEYGLWTCVLGTTCFKTTMFCEDGLNIWASAPDDMPHNLSQLCSLMRHDPSGAPIARAQELAWLAPTRLAAMTAHVLKAHETNIDLMKGFANSLDFSSDASLLNSAIGGHTKIKDDDFASALVAWSVRGAKEASNDDAQQVWAQVFWRTIFLMETANQHHWLKKASALPELHVALPFWNEEFEKTIDTAMGRRKRTKEIHSLLSNMSLLNKTAQVVDLDSRSKPKRSKM